MEKNSVADACARISSDPVNVKPPTDQIQNEAGLEKNNNGINLHGAEKIRKIAVSYSHRDKNRRN